MAHQSTCVADVTALIAFSIEPNEELLAAINRFDGLVVRCYGHPLYLSPNENVLAKAVLSRALEHCCDPITDDGELLYVQYRDAIKRKSGNPFWMSTHSFNPLLVSFKEESGLWDEVEFVKELKAEMARYDKMHPTEAAEKEADRKIFSKRNSLERCLSTYICKLQTSLIRRSVCGKLHDNALSTLLNRFDEAERETHVRYDFIVASMERVPQEHFVDPTVVTASPVVWQSTTIINSSYVSAGNGLGCLQSTFSARHSVFQGGGGNRASSATPNIFATTPRASTHLVASETYRPSQFAAPVDATAGLDRVNQLTLPNWNGAADIQTSNVGDEDTEMQMVIATCD